MIALEDRKIEHFGQFCSIFTDEYVTWQMRRWTRCEVIVTEIARFEISSRVYDLNETMQRDT